MQFAFCVKIVKFPYICHFSIPIADALMGDRDITSFSFLFFSFFENQNNFEVTNFYLFVVLRHFFKS